MAERSVISVHAPQELAQRLERLAKLTHRSKSSLAHQAIEGFVQAEENFIERINQGIAEADAGLGRSTEEMLERGSQRYLGKSYNS